MYVLDERMANLIISKTTVFSDRLVLEILWNTGIKLKELNKIKPNDIGKYYIIIPSISPLHSNGEDSINNSRKININSSLYNYLMLHINRNDIDNNQYVFNISSQRLIYIIRTSCKRAYLDWNIIKQISAISFRYGYAKARFLEGKPISEVQYLLGHKNYHTTRRLYRCVMDNGMADK